MLNSCQRISFDVVNWNLLRYLVRHYRAEKYSNSTEQVLEQFNGLRPSVMIYKRVCLHDSQIYSIVA